MPIAEAVTTDEYASAKALIEEDAASLGIDLCFQNFLEALAKFKRSVWTAMGLPAARARRRGVRRLHGGAIYRTESV